MSTIKPTAAQMAQQQAAKRQAAEAAQQQAPEREAGKYGIGIGDQWQPPPVTSVEDTGLNQLALVELILKVLYFSGFLTGYQIAEIIKLPFNGIVDGLLEILKREQWVEVKGSGGIGEGTYQYVITGGGIAKAREAMERSQYAGPAPVPLQYYYSAIKEQQRRILVTQDMMATTLSHLVISRRVFDKVGPAVNSGRSIFLYGPPGNGKTTISEAVGRVVLGQGMYIPYAIDIDGQVVRVFDNVNHEPIEEPEEAMSTGTGAAKNRPDARWIKIKRPVIIVGGELTLETLDLVYDPINKYYEAPFQVKSNGGMFLIDDFGRQQVRPRDRSEEHTS